jgi:hypothetical protein
MQQDDSSLWRCLVSSLANTASSLFIMLHADCLTLLLLLLLLLTLTALEAATAALHHQQPVLRTSTAKLSLLPLLL